MEQSFDLEEQSQSELLQASERPFVDNTTVCKCKASKFMCLRERGRNACPCKNIGRFCSSACHKESQETCLNKQTVADGDCSSSEDSTVSTIQSVK